MVFFFTNLSPPATVWRFTMAENKHLGGDKICPPCCRRYCCRKTAELTLESITLPHRPPSFPPSLSYLCWGMELGRRRQKALTTTYDRDTWGKSATSPMHRLAFIHTDKGKSCKFRKYCIYCHYYHFLFHLGIHFLFLCKVTVSGSMQWLKGGWNSLGRLLVCDEDPSFIIHVLYIDVACESGEFFIFYQPPQ